MLIAQGENPQTEDIFGTVSPPPGVEAYDTAAGGIGLILFISNLIKVATVVAGIWVMLNFILAGYDYIFSSGDTGAHKRVSDRITMSVIGLAVIVAAYTITGVISLLLFGDATYILNPVITGPTAPAVTPDS